MISSARHWRLSAGVLAFALAAWGGAGAAPAAPAPAAVAPTPASPGWAWQPIARLGVRGLGWAADETSSTDGFAFGRLPTRAKDAVSSVVWRLSRMPAGAYVDFETDAPQIAVRWDTGLDAARLSGAGLMNHMAPSGSHGLDLYEHVAADTQRAEKSFQAPRGANLAGEWRFCGVARPELGADETTAIISVVRPYAPGPPPGEEPYAPLADLPVAPMPPGAAGPLALPTTAPLAVRKYRLHLPLYHQVRHCALATSGSSTGLRPWRAPGAGAKPIVFYGTSITQGGCASRPGMAHPAIVGRALGAEVINLGFSGSGKMEAAMGALCAEIDAQAYVLECLPNMTTAMVAERVMPFVRALHGARPAAHIALVMNPNRSFSDAQNAELVRAYKKLKTESNQAEGTAWLDMIASSAGHESEPSVAALTEEPTVDGVHPTDLGFVQMAERYLGSKFFKRLWAESQRR